MWRNCFRRYGPLCPEGQSWWNNGLANELGTRQNEEEANKEEANKQYPELVQVIDLSKLAIFR